MSKPSTLAAGSALGGAGAASLAAFSTLCCEAPALFAIVGASGAVAAANLEPYRAYLMAGAGVMLAAGFTWARKLGARGTCSVRRARLVRAALWISVLLALASAVTAARYSWLGNLAWQQRAAKGALP